MKDQCETKVTKRHECYSRGWWELKGSMDKKGSESNKEAHEHIVGKIEVWTECGWGVDGGKSATYPVELYGILNILRGIIELGGVVYLRLGGTMSLEAS